MKVQRPVNGKFIWKILCFLNGDISSCHDKMIEGSGEAIFHVLKSFFLLIFFFLNANDAVINFMNYQRSFVSV